MRTTALAFTLAAALGAAVAVAQSGWSSGGGGATCSGAAAVSSLTSSGDIATATLTSSGAISSTAGTNQTAVSLANCSRIIQTTNSGNYISLCDSAVKIPTDVNLTDGNMTFTGVNKFIDLFGTMGIRNSQSGSPTLVNDPDGLRIAAQATLGKTCGTGADTTTVGPGTLIIVIPASGKGQLCICIHNSGTPIWVNALADGASGGSNTVCPATP